jgi:O-antigen/teichoic acid export membrane protein
MLPAILAFTGMGLADRYVLEAFRGVESVGVYSFYSYIKIAILTLVEGSLFALFQPKVLRASEAGSLEESRRLLRQLARHALLLTTLLCTAAALLIRPVVWLTGKPVYGEDLDAFGVILGLTLVTVSVNVLRVALYARHADRALFGLGLFGFIATVSLATLLIPLWGLVGAALAALGGFVSVALGALWVLRSGT